VDPFIGTGGLGFAFAALTPAAQVPLGLVRVGPDTTNAGQHVPIQHQGGYNDRDPHVRGFSHTHFVGTGVADYGNVRVIPTRELDGVDDATWFTTHDHETEDAAPGTYAVSLVEPEVDVRLAAEDFGAIHTYDFAMNGAPAHVAVDVTSSVLDRGVEDAEVTLQGRTLEGWVRYRGGYVGRSNPFTLYVSMQVDQDPVSTAVFDGAGLDDMRDMATGQRAGGVWTFADGASVTLRVGVSMLGLEEARAERVADDASVEDVAAAARALWIDKLSRIRIGGGTEDERIIFYTALYNAFRMPTRLSEPDGRYVGLDAEVATADGFTYYSDLSLWDSFRTTHPLYALIDHEVQRSSLLSLLAMSDAVGAVPRWPAGLSVTGGMLSTSADALFGESALKGVEGVPYEEALDALLITADGRPPEEVRFRGRDGIEEYKELGFVPEEEGDAEEAVSRTLEFAYHDWAISNLARHVGRMDVAERFAQRAQAYQQLFDPETKFFRPKTREGTFIEEFDPLEYFDRGGTYTEGTAWHWRFYVPHDPEGLRELYGAEDFAALLEEFFVLSAINDGDLVRQFLPDKYYWHGNQPPLHVVFLFAATGKDDRLDFWVDKIRTRAYTTEPSGLRGNDDGGTLSSWYVFAALGLYPRAGGEEYTVVAPVFERAEVDLGGGGMLTIRAPGASPERRFAASVTLGGEAVQGRTVVHGQLKDAELVYTMAP